MRKIFRWSEWSIATKILFLFLGLSIISMGVIGFAANANIRSLGKYAVDSSTNLGESAIEDSVTHLIQLGESIVKEKARDVAKQVEMYLEAHPMSTIEEMQADQKLREIVVQPVGTTGYTTLIDPVTATIIIHKYPGQEKNLDPLATVLPSFWKLLKSSADVEFIAGYYDWQEVDGSVNQKYAGIQAINSDNFMNLTLWATTYITEFSMPSEMTKTEINAAIEESSRYINNNVDNTRDLFFIIFTILLIVVIGLGLLLSRVITSPIQALKKGAEEIGHGDLDYVMKIKNRDELGDLAHSFNIMAAELKTYTEQLKSTAAENIEKEKQIQENLRIYMKMVGQAQEDERKRIARELHDDTIQALVVVSRELEELSKESGTVTAKEIRSEIRKIIEGLRHFTQDLRPSILDDLGLIPAVKWLVSDLGKKYGIKATMDVTGEQRTLPSETELMLFRIIQEALTNIRRHARATQAAIKIQFTDDRVVAVIEDNGRGFEVPDRVSDLTRDGKLGLAGMNERVELLGGTLNIETRRGEGSILTVDVPA